MTATFSALHSTLRRIARTPKMWFRKRSSRRTGTWRSSRNSPSFIPGWCALRKWRRRKPDRTVSLDEEVNTEDDSLPREVADWSPNPEQMYNQAELRDILTRTIQGLPAGFRTVFVLRDGEGLSTDRK